MLKNLLFVDFDVDETWSFFKGLNQDNSWVLKKKICNGRRKNRLSNFKRIIAYFNSGRYLFSHVKDYCNIVTWQQMFGIICCFLISFFKPKCKANIYILNFIYKEKKGLIGKWYYSFVKRALCSTQLKKIFVLSSYEIGYYSKLFKVPSDKFVFSHIGLDKKPLFEIRNDGYYLSAGRSNRDYDFLVSFFYGRKEKLIIISDTYKNNKLSDNIIILDNCFNDDYERMVANSFSVIIALDDNPISSGQLVASLAFLYQKPVLASNNPGIIDYVIDGTNGFIFEKSKESLEKCIEALNNPKVYLALINSIEPFSEYNYGCKVSSSII